MVLIPLNEFIEIRDLPDGLSGFDICGLGLCEGNAGEGFYLTREISGRGTEGGES